MSYVMTVSPDFPPNYLAGWYIFNTWLQRQLDLPIHLELYDSFAAQREAIANDEIDLIYANPYDASMLVREKEFSAIAAPHNRADEAIIATASGSEIQEIADLQEGTRIVHTDDPDVNMIGMIMLEPADLNTSNTSDETVDSYPLVAKKLLQGEADVGFFLDEAYETLSCLTKDRLRVLIRSEIFVIKHVLLAGSKLQEHKSRLEQVLLEMADNNKGRGVLESMGFQGWEKQTQEDTEFMIDLMDTLVV